MSLPGLTFPLKTEVLEELSLRWGPPTANFRWRNVRIKTTRDEVDEGKALIYDRENVNNIDNIDDSNLEVTDLNQLNSSAKIVKNGKDIKEDDDKNNDDDENNDDESDNKEETKQQSNRKEDKKQ